MVRPGRLGGNAIGREGGDNIDLTVNDFFCGCGGFGWAFQNAGYTIRGAWDFDKYAVQSYAANVGDHVRQADIRQMQWDDVPSATVWTFGFPCQDLSVAGKQAGLFEGKRSGLFFEVMRLLDETAFYDEGRLPTFIVAENVKGLRQYLPTLRYEYEARGYTMHYALYNSKYWGVPQNRERYYVVGVKVGIPFEMPTETQGYVPRLLSVLETLVDEKYYIPDDKARTIIEQAVAKTTQESYGVITGWVREGDVFLPRDIANACDANYSKGIGCHQTRTCVVEPKIDVIGLLDATSSGTTSEHNRRVYDTAGVSPTCTAGVSPTCTAVSGGTHHVKILDPTMFRVRRLTPTEYGRLQAFPMDRWRQVVSNSQAYKQFGNAVTTTVAQAVAVSIKASITNLQREVMLLHV